MPGQNGGRGAAPDAPLDREQREALRTIVVSRGRRDRPPVAAGYQTISQIDARPDLQGGFQGLQQGVVHEQHGALRRVAMRSETLVQEASEPLKGIPAGRVRFDPVGRRYAHLARQVPHQVQAADPVRSRTPLFDRTDDAVVDVIE